MAKQKLKKVDKDLCDRFMQVIDESGFINITIKKIFGLKPISMINEIRKYVTEPSKKLIKIAAEELGYNQGQGRLADPGKRALARGTEKRPGKIKGRAPAGSMAGTPKRPGRLAGREED